MIELSTFLWVMALLFAIIGFGRGWTKEVIALTGIVLGLFILEQFNEGFIQPFTSGAEPDQQFFFKAGVLLLMTFFGYQTPDRLGKSGGKKSRSENLQERLLGAMVGGFNGYLVFGSMWYYMRQASYPLSPFISAPLVATGSAAMELQLPLDWLLAGNLLTLLLVVLFLFVIIVLI